MVIPTPTLGPSIGTANELGHFILSDQAQPRHPETTLMMVASVIGSTIAGTTASKVPRDCVELGCELADFRFFPLLCPFDAAVGRVCTQGQSAPIKEDGGKARSSNR